MALRKSTIASLLAMGASAQYTLSNPDLANFVVLDASFSEILGANASITLLYNATEPLFHEGPSYNATGDVLYASSNRIALPTGSDPSTTDQTIKLSAIYGVSGDPAGVTIEPLSTDSIAMPNGGVAYTGSSGMIFVAQGTKEKTSGVFSIPDPLNNPNESVPLVTSFMGRQFNSPNDVVVLPSDGGSIWFTDPSYGASQGVRPEPTLPNQVYRYDPATNTTRVMADKFDQPNGLAFNADGSILYVTDCSADTLTNPTGFSTIYAFDVVRPAITGGIFVANRRVFAFAPEGIPDGIKVDAQGNVWAGTAAGVVAWSAAGDMLGLIAVEGGAANFGFGATESTMFVLGEKMLWRVELA